MNRFIETLLLASAAAAVLSACVKEMPAPDKQREMVVISATVPETTKVAFDDAENNGLALSWEDGDCIRVISGEQSEQYDILDGFDEHTARFRGPDVNGTNYSILYPGDCESVAEAEAFDFAGQVQNGNANRDHLRYLAVLQDVDTKDNISFSSEWASAHGGSYKQNGVVKFEITIPDGLSDPRKVTLSGLSKDIVLNLKNIKLPSSRVLTAYAVTPWEDVEIPSGSSLVFTVTGADGSTWSRTVSMSQASSLKAGRQSVFRLTKGFEETLFAGGDGTEANPYLISGAKHLYNMHADGVLEQGKKTWFKMIDDADMSTLSQDWEPLNGVNPYSCEVDFNGDGHTIDGFSCSSTTACPGFFSVLYGKFYNAKFTNAVITKTDTNSGHPCGILAGYGGYNARPTLVYNVHVHGSIDSKNVNGVGGMFGRINSIDIESCSADCEITSGSSYVGGLFGYETAYSVVRNCWTSGTITASQRVGGICGGLIKYDTAIYNCYSTATINASFAFGGIAGHCNLDQKSSVSPSTTYPNNVIQKCIAWNESLKAKTVTSGDKSHYSSGAIAAYISTHNNLIDCMRRADLDFQEYSDLFTLYDQENAGPDNPLVIKTVDGANYNFPYHGKAAASGKTLSQVARSLGWNETVWDLSGSVPVLTGEAELENTVVESGASKAPQGTNPKPGQGEIRPSAGNGWTVQTIASGITYYTFDGVESVTGDNQQIFVIDFDLNSTKYKLKFVYENPAVANSDVFAKYDALASINCGYEIGSIVFKNDGIGRSYMPNNEIADTGVFNWKSEGAFYFDGNHTAKISFDGYGLSISEQRKFYTYNTGEWPNIVSSAPMLINNYYPSGVHFLDNYSSGTNSEHPYVHQRKQHPRTAVALTEGNHLLMIVVDGRTSYSVGMNAKQLTNFLINNFNPSYAINLDGGGSSTMCVRGQGDSSTHVVNYPCDNEQHDHDGQRARDTHLCIVEAN